MSKIHRKELFAILMLSAAWSVLCLPEVSSSAQLLGIGITCGVQFLLSIPMVLLTKQGFSLSRMASRHKGIGFVYILFFLLWGANGFSQLWEVSSEIFLPVSGTLTAAVLMTVTCLYTCSLGIHALARSAPIVLGIFLLSVGILVIGAYGRIDITRLAPETEDFLHNGYSYFCMCGELTAAFVLLDRTKQGQKQAVWGYLAGKAVFACLVVFLCICAAGRLAAHSEYPFFTLTALSQPLQSQRADALYILVFVLLYVMHITLQTGVITHLLYAMFPKWKYTAPLSLAVMLLLSWRFHLPDGWYGALILVTAFVIPLIILLYRRYSHEKDSSASAASVPDRMRHGAHQ